MTNIKLKDRDGNDVIYSGINRVSVHDENNNIVIFSEAPTGNINITHTRPENVMNYATAQVVDSNLIAENIKKNTNILGIAGKFTEDATATEYTILNGNTAYVNGEKITGTIPTKTSSDVVISANNVSVSTGYYSSVINKSVSTVAQATPTISVSTGGLISATSIQSNGYVVSGTKTANQQLNTKAATTYNPTTNDQTITSGQYLTGNQTIKGDTNLIANNIKRNVNIFGVTGTYAGENEPTGTIYINDIQETDVKKYAIAQVVDNNLKAENIKENVNILGITGTYKGETSNKAIQYTTTCGSVIQGTGVYINTNVELVVTKSGKYNISWFYSATNTSSRHATKLYIDEVSTGGDHFISSQYSISMATESGINLTVGQTISIYAKSYGTGSTYVGGIIIEEVTN